MRSAAAKGHAIARMTRGGKAFSVSNQVIVQVKNALVGPDAIKLGEPKQSAVRRGRENHGDGGRQDAGEGRRSQEGADAGKVV
jgi:hypothetical protein